MMNLARTTLVLAGAIALAAARVQAPPNVLEVVVANGPFAGTYKPPVSEVICMHAKKQGVYTSTWKNFDAHNPKGMAEAGIDVNNPDVAGAKLGTLRISFGDPDKKPTIYMVNQVPLTLTTKGKGAAISGQGKTKEGVQFRVTANCGEVEQL